MTYPDEVKDKFNDDSDSVLLLQHPVYKLILLGYPSAVVGTDCQTLEGVIGLETVDKCNINGLLLLGKCAGHTFNLLITYTVFCQLSKSK